MVDFIFQTTPVGIAFLKGHIGMVDYLLGQPGVDINFKNDEGMFDRVVVSLTKTSSEKTFTWY